MYVTNPLVLEQELMDLYFKAVKITPYYDSLIAKVICKGRNRTEAIQRTLRSLDEFVLEGITTTIDLHKKILNHKKFMNSKFDTNWLSKRNSTNFHYNSRVVNHKSHDQKELSLDRCKCPSIEYKYFFVIAFS